MGVSRLVEGERELYARHRGRKQALIAVLCVIVLALMVFSVSNGAAQANLMTTVRVLGEYFRGAEPSNAQDSFIILQVRLPRVAAAVLIGAALAVAGLIMQTMLQNPLVSPFTLGVSSGAAFGASLAIVFSSAFSLSGYYLIPAMAFLFAVLTMIVVYAVVQATKRSNSAFLLTGLAISYLFTALVSGLKYIADVRELPELVFWQMGSLSGMRWTPVLILLGVVAVCVPVAMYRAWDFNVSALGAEEAAALGVNYRRLQALAFIVATLLTAVAVSFGGVIGFVGIVAPHVATMLVGADMRYALPVSVMLGGGLLMISDALSRTIIAPTELPVGIITSLVGVPFFLFLIVRRR